MPKSLFLLAAVFAAFVGAVSCAPKGVVISTNRHDERQAISAEFGAVKADVRRLTPKSAEEELQAAIQRAQALRTRLVGLRSLSVADQTRMAALDSEIKRLEAALQVQQARSRWENLLAAAKLTSRQQRLSADEKRALLRQQWPEFRTADDALMAAERAYTDASNELALNLRREEGPGS